MAENFDLFGDPVAAGHGRRGRPEHLPTLENRNKVNMLLAFGWGNERIAAALRISLPTLRRHYFSELKFRDVARDRLDAATAMHLWKQVEAGNVGAIREFRRLQEQNDLVLFRGEHRASPQKAEDRDEDHNGDGDDAGTARLGKKEAANIAAKTAHVGTAWGEILQ